MNQCWAVLYSFWRTSRVGSFLLLFFERTFGKGFEFFLNAEPLVKVDFFYKKIGDSWVLGF
jgi:hypothetical protein